MAAALARLPGEATTHPAFDPLRPYLAKLAESPGVEALNALLDGAETPPRTASGHAIRFCLPASDGGRHYERQVFDTGRVDTRPDNLHDVFNALAWLAFPRTKAAINARHVASMANEGNERGPLRDLLTLVDEGGVFVACSADALPRIEALVKGFEWQSLYWEGREALVRDARFVLFGHSAYEKALSPYPGITCKALFLPVGRDELVAPASRLTRDLDAAAASWVSGLPEDARPSVLPPLPVFGYPGWLPGSAHSAFYADRRWFRAAPAGRPRNAAKVERSA